MFYKNTRSPQHNHKLELIEEIPATMFSSLNFRDR